MKNLIRKLQGAAIAVQTREEGQGSFEWLLLIGVVVTALIAASAWDALPNLVTTVVGFVETEISELFT